MSLRIEVDEVSGVLLGNQWHDVVVGTFHLDAYEYGSYYPDRDYASGRAFDRVHGGGHAGICPTGFGFQSTEGAWIYGPLTAVQAVKRGDQK